MIKSLFDREYHICHSRFPVSPAKRLTGPLFFVIISVKKSACKDFSRLISTTRAGVRVASEKEYLDFILKQLSGLEGVSYRPMMGEYILYFRKK